ncbi:MAG: metallophosphoesterase, partial [Pedobacter sp.]
MERRSAVKNIGGLFLLPALGLGETSISSTPVLRLAHITDVHLKNDLAAPTKFAKCLHHVQQQSPKVELILNGGDVVFDMNKESLQVIDDQWKLLESTMKNESSLPVKYCLGNHDIWWNEQTKGDVFYGKKYSMDKLQLNKPYYSFLKAGWKFI